MCQENLKSLVLVLRSIEWPFIGKVEVYHSDYFGNQKLERIIDIKAPGQGLDTVKIFLQESREAGIGNVVVDLENVLNVFSGLLGFYCFWNLEVKEGGGKFVLANPTPRVLKIIELLEFDKIFTITHSMGEAFEILFEEGGSGST